MQSRGLFFAAVVGGVLVATSRAFVVAPRVRGVATVLGAVTKKNRRRVTEKNTGGAEGLTAGRKQRVDLPNRLFFANVAYDVDEAALVPFFSAVGTVVHCKVVRDSFTGGSKGWGFVTFSEAIFATNALRTLHGKPLVKGGLPIRLGEATSLARKRKVAKATAAFERREAKRLAAKEEPSKAASTPSDGDGPP